MTTILLGAIVLFMAALLAYIADRGLCNAIERIGIACLLSARRMRARREAVAKRQGLQLMGMQSQEE